MKSAVLLVIAIFSSTYLLSQPDTTIANYKEKAIIGYEGGLYFNRVEGYTPFLKGGVKFSNMNISGGLNYSTNKKAFTYNVDLGYQLVKDKLVVGGSFYDKPASNEVWTISRSMNTLMGILFSKDYMNYYSKKGYEFYSKYIVNEAMSLGVRYSRFDYVDWGSSEGFAKSLFKSKNEPRVNPAITEGTQNSIEFNLTFNKQRNSMFFDDLGWQAGITYKNEFGDFENNMLNISSLAYIPTWGFQKLRLESNLIMNQGDYLQQYLYGLGGLKIMKAFHPYADIGQNLFYADIQYQFAKRSTKGPWFKPVVFCEIAKVWDSSKISNAHHDDILIDAGVMLLSNGLGFGGFNVGFAQQICNGNSWRVFVNFEFPKLLRGKRL